MLEVEEAAVALAAAAAAQQQQQQLIFILTSRGPSFTNELNLDQSTAGSTRTAREEAAAAAAVQHVAYSPVSESRPRTRRRLIYQNNAACIAIAIGAALKVLRQEQRRGQCCAQLFNLHPPTRGRLRRRGSRGPGESLRAVGACRREGVKDPEKGAVGY